MLKKGAEELDQYHQDLSDRRQALRERVWKKQEQERKDRMQKERDEEVSISLKRKRGSSE